MFKIVAIGRGKMKGKRLVVGKGATETEARFDWIFNWSVDPAYPIKYPQQWKMILETN